MSTSVLSLEDFTHPSGAPNILCFRLVDTYTSLTAPDVKEHIELSMKESDSVLRVLICTSAFGMGIDCKGIQSIIHWKPPNNLEEYIQEVGRGGREGKATTALLCLTTKCLTNVEPSMKDYCNNTIRCRRDILMSHFVTNYKSSIMGSCICCDLCERLCKCNDCSSK